MLTARYCQIVAEKLGLEPSLCRIIYGTTTAAYRQVDWHVCQRVRDFLARRHKVRGRGTVRFSIERVYGELGLIRLEKLPRSKSAEGLQ